MNKQEFLRKLKRKLSHLPKNERKERLEFYSEMISDRMEEGSSEEKAVADLGAIDELAAQITADGPLITESQAHRSKRRLKGWEITLLAVGSPLWFSLAVTAVAVLFSLYVSAWAVIISLWAACVSVGVAPVCGVFVSGVCFFKGNPLTATSVLAVSACCAGLTIFLSFGCKIATRGMLLFTKKLPSIFKNFFRKENV